MSSGPITSLWAVLTNMVLYSLFDVFLVVRVPGWKQLLGMWPISFFVRKDGKRICRRSSAAKILQNDARGLRIAFCHYISVKLSE